MSNIRNYSSLNKKVSALDKNTKGSKFGGVLESLQGAPELASLAGMANGLINNKKYDTNIETRVVTDAPFTYTNRLGYLKNRNSASFRNLLNSRSGTPVNATQALAQTLKADNEIAFNEGERQDKNIEEFNNRKLQIDNSNIQAINRNNVYNNMLKNEQVANKTAVFDSFLENIQTNTLQRNKEAMDKRALEAMKTSTDYGRAIGIADDVEKAIKGKAVDKKTYNFGKLGTTIPLGIGQKNTPTNQNIIPKINYNKIIGLSRNNGILAPDNTKEYPFAYDSNFGVPNFSKYR